MTLSMHVYRRAFVRFAYLPLAMVLAYFSGGLAVAQKSRLFKYFLKTITYLQKR
jgi:hypothetical protein